MDKSFEMDTFSSHIFAQLGKYSSCQLALHKLFSIFFRNCFVCIWNHARNNVSGKIILSIYAMLNEKDLASCLTLLLDLDNAFKRYNYMICHHETSGITHQM